MTRLVYRSAALADLDAIYDVIESDSPRRALSFVDAIRSRCRTLCDHTHLGPARDDLGIGIRVYPIRGRIIVAYRVEADTSPNHSRILWWARLRNHPARWERWLVSPTQSPAARY